MPYGIKRVGGRWVVYNKDTGRAMGRHRSKDKANAQLAALHIHVGHGVEDHHEVVDSPAEGGAVKPVAGRPEDDSPVILEGWGGVDRRSGKYL